MTSPDSKQDPPAQSPNPGADAEPFDAVSAAAELEEVLGGLGADPVPEVAGGEYAARLEADVLELSALVERRDAQVVELEGEIDRVRARVEKDAEKQIRRSRDKHLLEVLEIVDDLERALQAAADPSNVAAVVDGVQVVRRGILARLASQGVRAEPAMGARFDPEVHDAVAAVPVADPTQSGVIVGVVREGYSIEGRVLRAARVAVGKHS